ncbi:MAG: sulfatase-like hydrolase/transferase [Gammaproteobacteria bacterium]
MKRRSTLKLLAGAAAATAFDASLPRLARAEPARPNIVVVVIDDLRFDECGFSGHPYLETPNIDSLARESASFTRAFHSTPLCSPNRACILTGEYVTKHGIYNNVGRDRLSAQLRTFTRTLQAAGYHTAHVGKWHMGDSPKPRPGYDYWVSFAGQGKILDPDLFEDGGLRRVPGYITDILTDRAVDYIGKRRDRGKPFCLFLGHKAIHPDALQRADGSIDSSAPRGYLAAERHRGRYAGKEYPKARSADPADASRIGSEVLRRIMARKASPEILQEFGSTLQEGADQQGIRDRAEMMLAVDECVGRLLAALDANGLADDTVVVFTSDNGYFFGEHGLGVERRFPYEESIHSPLLIRYPGKFRAGDRIEGLVSMIDIAPTLLDLAGLAPTANMQGRSLLPLAAHDPGAGRPSVLIEYYSHDQPMPWVLDVDYRAVRTERHKLIHWVQYPDLDELYDLQPDPLEMQNLAGRADTRELRAALRAELLRLVGESLSL